MKVSFSRKGFDSKNGGQPNAILPDGTLLPFPIPDSTGKDRYNSLVIDHRSFFDIISELRPRTQLKRDGGCHLDPDLIMEVKYRKEGWKPAFGQADQSLSELRNNDFGEGDLFLFFGWFRETEYVTGKLRYKRNAPDIQLIYGYMQVGSILSGDNDIPDWLMEHPHVGRIKEGSRSDAIFLPTEHLDFLPVAPGASMLKFSPELILTASGMTRSKWKLPDFFKEIKIGHSPKQPENKEYFQSATIGQEMIWECTEEAIGWIKKICQLHVV
ncbi:MAG: hypothetical protein K2K98_08010 [Muribaculaceae bacterium]|nr:hypothetical protein [Muribaculaceae bacterium]